jgi:GT2 family glycosyltransferase
VNPGTVHVLASIIIPNFNGCHHLGDCLNALRRQTYPNSEIILVDNASSDGSVTYVQEAFPEVQVITLDKNYGFTGACNRGYEASHGDCVILLNNDTEVESGWLASIVDAFEQHPEVGIVASKMLLFDRRDHFHAAGDFYRVDGLPGNRGVWQRDQGQYDEPEQVFGACGGAAAYRRTMIDEIGFLDESFYFSCEDVDISWRANLAGWKVLYVPQAIVYHKLKATGGSATASYYDGRNFLYVIWKNYPLELLRRHWLSIIKAQWRIAREALGSWRGAAARARLRGQLAGLVGLGRMLGRRRQIQASRRQPIAELEKLLTPVDAAGDGQ